MRKILLAMLFSPLIAHANVIISATREIYPSDSKEIAVQLLNNGSDPSLVQAWIDDGDPDSTPETANVPFLLIPPVVKISGHSGQQLKVKYIGGNQPKDRESIFYLNVLDIPPTPENMQGKSIMQLAIKSRIKFFFRPSGIQLPASAVIEKVKISRINNQIVINNPTPYYLTLSAISIRTSKQNLLQEGVMIAPFSQHALATKATLSVGETLSIIYINDYGASIHAKIDMT